MTASLGVVDRVLYALFARHADRGRHDADRKRYRASRLPVSFDVFLARVYGASWLAFASGSVLAATAAALLLPPTALGPLATTSPLAPSVTAALVVGLPSGLVAKRVAVELGGRYLGWRARSRRTDIVGTLPGAVRYLSVLASGTTDERELLSRVADRPTAYGETAAAFQDVLNTADLTGSVDRGLRVVARDTPSRELLAPFLLKLREHAAQGPDAVAQYLELESRMLANRRERTRERAAGFLELVAELFIVLLVLPALLVIVATVLSVLAPGLGRTVATPLGAATVRELLVFGSGGFVLVVGALAAYLVETMRPRGFTWGGHDRSTGLAVLANVTRNPADAAIILALPTLVVGGALWKIDIRPANAVLLSYVAFAVPVGFVAVRRARIDDAKDREIQDFVHAVSGHVSLGRPFGDAVERVARDVDAGPLNPDIRDLAFNLGVTTRGEDVRAAALDRFVERVDTQLAAQTVGLVSGALDAGSDADAAFEALQAEVGRLYHEKRALRSRLLVYVAVGWTTAILVVGITVAVNLAVLDSFAQLSSVSNAASAGGLAIDPGAVDLERDRYRFYLVTQATMLSCGWFAGAASRGRYDALLHSGLLVAFAYAVFAGVGML
ncbi:type II secretion system F family protein [Halobacterium noricense]|uniref:type II secretion system F family protein n=1 Tax=Halobacterium noricense TaxID=223182 RepID=UPI001E4A129C|nr:type II secretion system F family protein [Halobacterium noricense]UHH25701.1 type II secretion system F family protein [Halobacterium noricense]